MTEIILHEKWVYWANSEKGSPLPVTMNRSYRITWLPIAAEADLTKTQYLVKTSAKNRAIHHT